MFVFSARTKAQLRDVIADFSRFLQEPYSFTLSDLAYSLQVGRNGMEERLGLLAHSLEELRHKVGLVLAGFSEPMPQIFPPIFSINSGSAKVGR